MCDILKEAPSNRRWLYLVIAAVFIGGLVGLPPKLADALIAFVLVGGGLLLGIWLLTPVKNGRQYSEW